jgi:uncharacterized protein (TIGR01777 family)
VKFAQFERRSLLPVPTAEAFAWHEREGALERLTPPWEKVELVERSGGIRPGGRVVMRVPMVPAGTTIWEAEHDLYEPPFRFRDFSKRGPFAHWVHTHSFQPMGDDACELVDSVEYALPLGALGALFGSGLVESRLARMFAYRHRITVNDLAEHALHRGPRLRVVVTGASGLVGNTLAAFLRLGGHEVVALRRSPSPASALGWEWDFAGIGDAPIDAVVHLAAENIGDTRWDEASKKRFRDSRELATRALAENLAARAQKPAVFVSASAVGYYGNRGDAVLDESSARGEGFLAELCEAWEAATAPAEAAGIRVVKARLGVVLTPAGGALAKVLPAARAGLAGPLGGGTPWLSWIGMDDAVYALYRAIWDERLRGPLNVVAPEAVTTATYAKAVGKAVGMPFQMPVPSFALRAAVGEMADEVLLASQRVTPQRLGEVDFAWSYGTLDKALGHLLGA